MPQIRKKILIFCQLSDKIGHQVAPQRCRLARIVVVWHCYTPIQCQTTTILASLHLWGATWWPILSESWQKIKIFSWSEAWNLPSCGCKSMTGGLTIVLGVFITVLYTYTMPNNHYSSKPTSLRCHLMANLVWKLAENQDFFLIWGMKPALMWL